MHDPDREPRLALDPDPHVGGGTAVRTDHRAAHLAKGERRPVDTLWRANPREQGLLGLTDAIAFFGARGWSISLPLVDSQPYDLVVDDGDDLLRVQVKTTTYRSPYGIYVVSLATRGGNQSYHTSKPFDPRSCDALFVLTDGGERYLIPSRAIAARTTINLGARYAVHRVAR